METTEILECNKLIAEFMGMNNVGGWYNLLTPHCLTVIDRSKTACEANELRFHSSWEWIMLVIEKIDQIGASVIIGRMFCEIGYINPLDQSKEFKVRIASGVKINAINGAVIEFIKWYNENK